MPLSLRIDVRPAPSEHFSVTVCLRQQVLRELGTLNVCGCSAAGPLLATSIGGCSSANGALSRRPICPQNPLQISLAKHVPQNFSAAQAGWHGASRRRRLLRGRGARKKASSECKRCALAHSYNSVGLVSSAQEWRVAARMRARCMCVRCPCALHPLTNPFAGCMAGREGCRKARGLEEDGRAVAALPRRDSPCCRTHPQPSHHVKQGWAVRVRGLFLC